MRIALLSALLLASASAPALTQQPASVEGRVGKLEKEMRAVQRKVFPNGGEQFLEPDIRPAAPAPAPLPAPQPNGALIDLTARVDALERQLQQITGQVEQNQFKTRQLEDAFNKLKSDTEFRLGALEGGTPSAPAGAAAGAPAGAAPLINAPPPPAAATRPAPGAAASRNTGLPPRGTRPFQSEPTPPPPVTAADAAPVDAAPSTGDPAEDAYLAGYRLWAAKKYPEAEAALKDAATKYPKHRRYSYAQNLLGRTYLDEGKPALAAEALYTNYRTMPRGERASDSLYYLGQALVQLKKTTEACRVYDELRDVYGEKLDAAAKARLATARTSAKCGA